ncbi:hypothetical protein LR48_Vigan07g165000 [Vigna angularis]|uniref:Uncharacterized protein n=1 Tax=Phaseolus angularis TaxID=3914 RepID=A0A0L9UZ44_PHAAN|nr:hypothetical protein LR48_Vigan07g165000 [Vigna angularis]
MLERKGENASPNCLVYGASSDSLARKKSSSRPWQEAEAIQFPNSSSGNTRFSRPQQLLHITFTATTKKKTSAQLQSIHRGQVATTEMIVGMYDTRPAHRWTMEEFHNVVAWPEEQAVSPLGERYLVLPSLLLDTIRSHLPIVKQVCGAVFGVHKFVITNLCKIAGVDTSAPPFERPRKEIDEAYYRQYCGGEEAAQPVPPRRTRREGGQA